MGSEVPSRLRSAAAAVFPGAPVRWAYLFGSQVTGRARRDSDIDVAVLVEPDAGVDAVALRLELAGALEDAAGLHGVQVSVLNDLPLPVVGRVLAAGVVLYSRDEPGRVAYESLMRRRFHDFELHARPLARELLAQIAEGTR